jgi:hypothetical protein
MSPTPTDPAPRHQKVTRVKFGISGPNPKYAMTAATSTSASNLKLGLLFATPTSTTRCRKNTTRSSAFLHEHIGYVWLFVSTFFSFSQPETVVDYQTSIFSARFYEKHFSQKPSKVNMNTVGDHN